MRSKWRRIDYRKKSKERLRNSRRRRNASARRLRRPNVNVLKMKKKLVKH